MIKFTKSEMEYVQQELNKLITSDNEACVILREELSQEDIKNINHFIYDVSKINVDEQENKLFRDAIYYHLGLYCWVDNSYTYEELLELIKDKQYVDLYKKLVLDNQD